MFQVNIHLPHQLCPSHTFGHPVQHDCDLLVFTNVAFEEAYEDSISHVFPFHLVCLCIYAPKTRGYASALNVPMNSNESHTYVAYPNTMFAVTFISPGKTMTSSLGFLHQKHTGITADHHKRDLFHSPFPAHVHQKYIESGLLLLHPCQYTLHTYAVLGSVGGRSVNGNHETVSIVFIPMTSKVQQTCGGKKEHRPLAYWHSAHGIIIQCRASVSCPGRETNHRLPCRAARGTL